MPCPRWWPTPTGSSAVCRTRRRRAVSCPAISSALPGRGAAQCRTRCVVEEAALPEAFERGWLRAAALDVFVREPLPADSPLWDDPRVIVSPHISGLTTTAGAVAGFLECAEALARGEWPKWVVDRDRGY